MRSFAAEEKRADVYNLTVDAVPEFFADGVLVHNCDSLRYLLSNLGTGPEFVLLDEPTATAAAEPVATLGPTVAYRPPVDTSAEWWLEGDDEGPRPGGTVQVP
ncbi:hypothetical protein ACIQVR_39670 [Streptomyces xanthochromogenes]|uniref:hypothetical protein n=1 Tax=Streptomyces xanthochromogenes TaxID=67384 RepID=UPI00380F3592